MKAGRIATILLGVVALLAMVGGGYVAGYMWMGKEYSVLSETSGYRLHWEREYGDEWQMRLFTPSAKLESWLTGEDVRAVKVTP